MFGEDTKTKAQWSHWDWKISPFRKNSDSRVWLFFKKLVTPTPRHLEIFSVVSLKAIFFISISNDLKDVVSQGWQDKAIFQYDKTGRHVA